MAEHRQPGRRGRAGRGGEGRGRRSRALLPVLAATGLLALVAVGSLRGPLGSGRGRPSYPADLVDSLLLLLLLAMVATAVLALVTMWPDRHLLVQRRRSSGLLGLLLPLAAILVLWLLRELIRRGDLARRATTATSIEPAGAVEAPAPPPTPGVVPLIVAGVAAAAMVAIVVAQLRAERRRRQPPRAPAEQLVGLLDDTVDDLEHEPDPRRAVIAAWARMERGLAAAGLPRQPAEAPFEYAARVLGSALVPPGRATPAGSGAASVQRLTGLFERAKFSHHRIDRADRDQAVAALRAVRQELAEAAELAAAPAGHERTGGR